MKTFQDRINLAFSRENDRRANRGEPRLRKKDIQAKTGVTSGAVTFWFDGSNAADMDKCDLIAELLHVNRHWLFDGSKPMLEADSNTLPGPEIRGRVPLISWVQAGAWSEVIDNLQPGEGERIETTYRASANAYALRVRGDSMEPKFPAGAILIVEPNENPEPGKYVIVRQNGDTEATFKQLVQDGGTLYLKPLNDRYPIMMLRPDAVFCGVVKRMEMDV